MTTVEFSDSLIELIESELSGGVATKSSSLEAMLSDLNIESMERVFPYAGEFEERTRRAGLHRFYMVKFRDDVPATKAAASLRSLQGVISAEPPRKIKLRTAFNDPLLSRQWHYTNSSRTGVDINVKGVWDNYTVGNSSVIVNVVDEPVDPTHPDLVGNLWKDSSGNTGFNFARNNADLSIRPGGGDLGHGTHVAGIIAAVNNNGTGLCGIAGGDSAAGIQGVLLQSSAIFSGDMSASDAATARALKYGADNGAVISQNSWGYYADTNDDGIVSQSELAAYKSEGIPNFMKGAIDYFIEYAGLDQYGNQSPESPMKGGLVFFAAGNEGIDYDPICDYEPVIAVGAFNEYGSRASYSNYGTWVDLAAPAGEGSSSGNSVWSTLPSKVNDGQGNILSTGLYGGTGWVGTSMACPHASGVAALIVSYYGGEGFTAEKAKDILFSGAGNVIGGNRPIGKKIDAYASFVYGGDKDENPLSLGIREATVKAHETRVLHLTVRASSGYTVNCTPGSDALVYDSSTGSVTITGRNALPGQYTATFVLVSGGETVFTLEFPYILLPNHTPTVNLGSYKFENIALSSTGVSFLKSKPQDLSVLFDDEDGEELHIEVESSRPDVVSIRDTGTKWDIKSLSFGLSTITVSATDGLGETASFSFVVAVKDTTKGSGAEAYPEAGTDRVSIWPASSEVKEYAVSVYSVTGAKVLELTSKGSLFYPIELDIAGLAPGVYTAHVTPKGGTVQKISFMKY